MRLTTDQIDQYRTRGWVAPVDVLSADEAAELLKRFEYAERAHPSALHAENRNNAHLQFPFLADIVTDERIVAAAQSLVGPDMFLWSTVLFIKEPNSSSFVSWHQDATYMGVEPHNFVTAWLALTPSNEDTGCVAVIDESHRVGRAAHEDRFERDNILTRGQTVKDVDESKASHLVLEPGQMSLHHPWLIHGSLPNRSRERRIGLAMQAYMGSDVRPTRGEHHVMRISGGRVPLGFFEAEAPRSENDTAVRDLANKAMSDVLYFGAEQRRNL